MQHTNFHITRQHLQNLLYSQGLSKDANDFVERLTAILLTQYAFQEVYAKKVARAYFNGSIYIEAVAWPIKLFSLLLIAALDDKADGEDAVLQLLIEAQRLRKSVCHSVNIYGIDRLLRSGQTHHIDFLLRGLTDNFHRLPQVHLLLADSVGAFCDQICQVYNEVDRHIGRGFLPPVTVPITAEAFPASNGAVLANLCDTALQMHNITFNFRDSYLSGWPNWREVPWILGTVVINLVQIAYKAGKYEIGKFWQEMEEVFTIVVKAHLDQKRFFLSLAEGPLQDFFSESRHQGYPLEKAGGFVEIAGLPESVRFVTGEEMTHEEGWELALQSLARLQELAKAVSRQHEIPIMLVDYVGSSNAEKHFLDLDRQKFPSVPKNFSEYTRGPHFSINSNLMSRERLEREGKLHRFIPSVVSLLPELQSKELADLLRYARDETEAIALKIR